MNKFMIAAVITLSASSAAYAAEKGDLMSDNNMMHQCESHMKNGKMMDSMPKDMMAQCQKMMKNGDMKHSM